MPSSLGKPSNLGQRDDLKIYYLMFFNTPSSSGISYLGYSLISDIVGY